MLKRLTTLSAAALLVALPVLAHDHGEAKGAKDSAQCPHFQAVSTSMTQAATLLEQALETKDAAQVKVKVAQARKALAGAEQHRAECQKVCSKMTGDHAGHAGHGAAAGLPRTPAPAGAAGMPRTPAPAGAAGTPRTPAPAAKVVDPVCGMKIDPATAAGKSEYAGKTYYFCDKAEKAKFDADPAKYVKKDS